MSAVLEAPLQDGDVAEETSAHGRGDAHRGLPGELAI
jgi:hypothetical protein